MSSALTEAQRGLLRELRGVLATLWSNYLDEFERLEWRLLAQRECEQCGVWFDGSGPLRVDECVHCREALRRAEALDDADRVSAGGYPR